MTKSDYLSGLAPTYSTDAEAERDALLQLLAIAGVETDAATIASWTEQQLVDARSWAVDQIAALRICRSIVRPPHVEHAAKGRTP